MIEEFEFMVDFAKEADFGYDICRKQLRSLWTAFCLHNDYECDTAGYDIDLKALWKVVDANSSSPWEDDEDGVVGFELFDSYMCEEVC